jgi:hypothetical protein
MQVIAIGKWSKADKRWQMVVALRRPRGGAANGTAQSRRRTSPRQQPHTPPSSS